MSEVKGSAPPGQRLLSGVEPHPGEGERWRIYVGSRWAWKYLLVSFEEAKNIYGVWQGTPHLWVRVPDDAEIFTVPVEDRKDTQEDEKKMYYLVRDLMTKGKD